jgi:hypothetical protein
MMIQRFAIKLLPEIQADRPVFRVADFANWRTQLRSDRWKGFFELQQQLTL